MPRCLSWTPLTTLAHRLRLLPATSASTATNLGPRCLGPLLFLGRRTPPHHPTSGHHRPYLGPRCSGPLLLLRRRTPPHHATSWPAPLAPTSLHLTRPRRPPRLDPDTANTLPTALVSSGTSAPSTTSPTPRSAPLAPPRSLNTALPKGPPPAAPPTSLPPYHHRRRPRVLHSSCPPLSLSLRFPCAASRRPHPRTSAGSCTLLEST